jgi:hypothetical protein
MPRPVVPRGKHLGSHKPDQTVEEVVARLTRSTPGLSALVSGTRSQILIDALAPYIAHLEAQITSDIGGDPTMVQQRLVKRFSQVSILADSVLVRLKDGDPTADNGRNARMLSVFLALIDREWRLATAIGQERRAKPVDPLEVVKAVVEKANAE